MIVPTQQLAGLYPNADDGMRQRIADAANLVNTQAVPQSVTAHFEVDDSLAMRGYIPSGQDIRRHLAGCREIAVCACTLGAQIDRLLERMKLTDLSLAYLVDQAASLAVENLAEREWRKVLNKARQEHKACTTRYSCGYGDYLLEDQRALLTLCGADKALRITVNEGGMMYPTKSITFLAGIHKDEV